MPINKEGTMRCYDTVAPFYSFFRRFTEKADQDIMPYVLDVLDLSDTDTVLDAGTGPGTYAIKIAGSSRGAEVHAVDLSPKFVELAQKSAHAAGFKRIRFQEGDLENLPFAEGRFDKLVCGGVISAVPSRERAAQ